MPLITLERGETQDGLERHCWVLRASMGGFWMLWLILQKQNGHSLNSFPLAFVFSTLIFPTVNESTVQNCHTLYIILREMLLYEFSV